MEDTVREQRKALARQIADLAASAVFGSLSETYRTCGNPGCRCHSTGPKHGPHLQVVYRSPSGKSTGYYVPTAAQDRIRAGVAAWKELQDTLRELAELNKDEILSAARAAKEGAEPKRPARRKPKVGA